MYGSDARQHCTETCTIKYVMCWCKGSSTHLDSTSTLHGSNDVTQWFDIHLSVLNMNQFYLLIYIK